MIARRAPGGRGRRRRRCPAPSGRSGTRSARARTAAERSRSPSASTSRTARSSRAPGARPRRVSPDGWWGQCARATDPCTDGAIRATRCLGASSARAVRDARGPIATGARARVGRAASTRPAGEEAALRIALFQGPEQPGTVAGNLERLRQAAGAAAVRGARLLVCPEMFLTGYAIGPEATSPARRAGRRPVGRQAAAIARASGLALLYGYPERGAGRARLQRRPALDRDGRRLANHRKTHLFGDLDRDAFRAGAGAADAGRARRPAARHPDLLRRRVPGERPPPGPGRAPTSSPCRPPTWCPTRSSPAAWSPARAYENQVFLAYANRCGREGELDYLGLSCVVGPDGVDLARAGGGEELITAELEPGRAAPPRVAAQHLPRRPPPRALRGLGPTGAAEHRRHDRAHDPSPAAADAARPVTYFGPDFPFAYDDWLRTRPAWAAAGRAARHRGRGHRRRRWPA